MSRRNHTLKIRVNDGELAQIDARVPDEMTRSNWLRTIALGRRLPTVRTDPELVRQVARIGNNLNQIARQLNRAGGASVPVLSELIAIRASLNALIAGEQDDAN